jgi:uncharacterized protein (DUF2267 family)
MSARISLDTIMDRLAERGLTDQARARRVLHATLAVVGERLVEDEAQALAEVLPDELAPLLATAGYDSDFTADELFDRVARREHVSDRPSGRAREEAEVVLAVLGDCLSADRRHRIARGLPGVAGPRVAGDRVLGEPPPYATAAGAPRGSTVASSRPGSTHPLSEAAPRSGQTHSVARNPAPHEETKLSASKGLTQERLDETLGTGRSPR